MSAKSTTTTPPADPSAKSPPGDPALLSASLSGAKFLILLQVFSRLLTFLVNQLLLRYLSPTLLGISVQLDLLNSSILYFSRESLRNALQRQPSAATQPVVNFSLLTLPLGVVFSLILSYSYVRSSDAQAAALPYFTASAGIYTIATLLELLSEPAFAVVQQKMLYKIRAAAESAAAAARVFVTCGVTIWASRNGHILGPLPFALGQTAYAVILVLVYLWKTSGAVPGFTMVPRALGEKAQAYAGVWPTDLTRLAATMWFQAAIKHVLTTGDALLIATLSTPHAQGIYALASNYGSLLARMLFQPVEESSRNLFSKLAVAESVPLLQLVLRVYLLFSTVLVALGPPFAATALGLVAGKRWAEGEAGETLAVYVYYLPLLAVNGVMEAFVQAVASSAELAAQSVWMVGFSGVFAVVGYVVLGTGGAKGLVLANAVNMLLRIVWAGVFVRGKCGEKTQSWSKVLPAGGVLAAAVGVGAVARSEVLHQGGIVRELASAAGLGVGLLAVVALVEREFFVEVWKMARGRR